MTGIDIFESHEWSLGALFGSNHPFLRVNSNTVIQTWIILAILLAASLFARRAVQKKDSTLRFSILSLTQFFIDLIDQALGIFHFSHLSFITTLFLFILLGNTLSIIPGLEEPTADLNTTLALGAIAFLYTQVTQIVHVGLWAYIKDYFTPFFVMFPLNIVGKLASVISISFRLFGNIFGGSIITQIYSSALQGSWLFQVLGIVTGINLIITLFFSLFEGFLQAFVFTMLTLTYLSIALHDD